jgi:hypothetical protein
VVPLTRRSLLAGAGALAIAACGGGSNSGSGTAGSGAGTAPGGPLSLVARFPVGAPLLVPGRPRVAVSIVLDGMIQPDGPATLAGRVVDDASGDVVEELSAVRRIDGTTTAYWAFRPQIDAPGLYTLRVDGDDGSGQAFQVVEPAEVAMPHIGSVIPPFDTPTVDDHRGVEPYCSLSPAPCPLHDVTLAAALTLGAPLAYMVGTPAHCQTGTCSPALELLIEAHEQRGTAVTMVHADVYSDNAGTTIAPAVDALGLVYEPVLYLCTADGTVVEHLDGIWDRTELGAALTTLIG